MTRPDARLPTAVPRSEARRADVDVTLLDENLKLTPLERLRKLAAMIRFLDKVRGVAAGGPASSPGAGR